MYEVTKLYTVSGSSITIEDSASISPVALSSRASINTRMYIGIRLTDDAADIPTLPGFTVDFEEDTPKEVGLNFSRLIVDRHFSGVTTWEELCSLLTDELIIGYTDTVPGYTPGNNYPRYQVVTWDVMTTFETFNVVLYDHMSLQEPRIRQTAEDIYITIHPNATEYPNLKNCIPVVNGYVCRPIMHKNGIIVKGAAKLFWNASLNLTPEVQLLDFSRIGDVYIVPTHEDHVKYRRGTYQLHIPNLSLETHTYLPIVNGTMILPDRYQCLDNHNIRFTPHHTPMNYAGAYRGFLDGDMPFDSFTAYESKNLQEHVDGQLVIDAPNLTDDFTIVVSSPMMYVARHRLDIFNNGFIMNLRNEEGVLFNECTGLIMDYHNLQLVDRQELLVQRYDDLYILDRKYDDKQVSFIRPDSDYIVDMLNIHHGDTIMVYLMK